MSSVKLSKIFFVLVLFVLQMHLHAQDIYQTTIDSKLRNGPSVKYKTLGVIKKGEIVNAIEKSNALWFKVEHKGKVGYLSSKLLIPIVQTPNVEDLPKTVSANGNKSPTILLLFIIGGFVIIVLLVSLYRGLRKRQTHHFNPLEQKNEIKHKEELAERILENMKPESTTNNSNSLEKDESIIDVTGSVYNIPISQTNLIRYSPGVPFWKHQYVYSCSEINHATSEQIKFYQFFKYRFLKGEHIDLEGNSNYSFILLFDLIDDYENHKNILLLKGQLDELGQFYPKTKPYLQASLFKKLEQLGDSATIERLKSSQNATPFEYISPYSQYLFEENYWGLGTKYQKELNLSKDEVEVLNTISYYSNAFFDLKYCGKEIIRLFLTIRKEFDLLHQAEGGSLDNKVSEVADVIVTKQLKYRPHTESYRYTIETYKRVIYTAILKTCENTVRDLYFHKRKLNADLEYIDPEYKREYELKIASKISLLTEKLKPTINLPDTDTEVELYSQNTTRWKIKFEELAANYTGNLKDFVDSVLLLGSLNTKNPSVENIFYEASKFISKYDRETALSLYVNYLYHDLKSATFDNKQLTKTIQKNIFTTNEQLHKFEKIVGELIKDRDLKKALTSISNVYKKERKKIQLDAEFIKQVQFEHSGTVELLDEYLKDNYEDEGSSIKTEEINNEEIRIEIEKKGIEERTSAYLKEIPFKPIHILTLDLFSKSNYSVSIKEFESFAKSNGAFKNQLIESINEVFYDIYEDLLIEEEESCYTISVSYFNRILAQ